ncbi:MAG: ComF family protein [Chloroflexia bacterium]|nr:ComF family protein [Chloroflexia bacterium]
MDQAAAPPGERLWQGFLDLLFPPRCVGCQTLGSWICPNCLAQVGRLEEPVCARCGRPWARGEICPTCSEGALNWHIVRAPFFFEGVLQKAVHELKYRGRRVLAGPLAELLAEQVREWGWPGAPLLAVPLHPARRRARGYNQSALLARSLARRLDWPLLTEGLARQRDTRPQVGLEREERLRNVQGAFAWVGRRSPPPRVVVLDDVYTTGATMRACAVALRTAGAVEVRGLALARPAERRSKR